MHYQKRPLYLDRSVGRSTLTFQGFDDESGSALSGLLWYGGYEALDGPLLRIEPGKYICGFKVEIHC